MKIGDNVIVKVGLVPGEFYGDETFEESMVKFEGKQAKIVGQTLYGWELDIDDELDWKWSFTNEMLCLIEE